MPSVGGRRVSVELWLTGRRPNTEPIGLDYFIEPTTSLELAPLMRVAASKMEAAMWRVSFLAALFSMAGIASVLSSQSLPMTWLGDAVWLVIAGSSALAVMAFEAEAD